MAKVDELLDALVDHATRHGGEGSQAILDAQAKYKGNPTNAQLTQAAEDEAAAADEAGKAANRKIVEDAAKKADKEDDDNDGDGDDS